VQCNDAWRLDGDRFLQICWRGDRDRFIREASMAATVPVPYPAPLDFGRDGDLSWILSPRVAGRTLDDAFTDAPEPPPRSYVRELAGLLRALHAWQPPVAAPPPTSGDAIGLVGGMVIPHTCADQLTLIKLMASRAGATRRAGSDFRTAPGSGRTSGGHEPSWQRVPDGTARRG
jgi:hypothetical protein